MRNLLVNLMSDVKSRFYLWVSTLLDISDNLLYIITLTAIKTRMGIRFRLWLIDGMVLNAADKIERERK